MSGSTEIALVAFGVPALLEFGKRISGLESIFARLHFVTDVLRSLRQNGLRPPGRLCLAQPDKSVCGLLRVLAAACESPETSIVSANVELGSAELSRIHQLAGRLKRLNGERFPSRGRHRRSFAPGPLVAWLS